MPPSAIPSSVFVAGSSSPRRSRNSIADACGNFGARPQPPQRSSKPERRPRTASLRSASVSGSRDASMRADARTESVSASACRTTSPRRSRYASDTERSTWRKLGNPCRGSGGKYVPPRNGSPGRREEDRHRPAAAAGERDDRVHVERVDVRPLLAVDLDVHEALVHHRGDLRILEGLVRHHVTPVARRRSRSRGGSACRRRAPARTRLPPRVPVDGIVRVLEQVRRRLLRQPIHGQVPAR